MVNTKMPIQYTYLYIIFSSIALTVSGYMIYVSGIRHASRIATVLHEQSIDHIITHVDHFMAIPQQVNRDNAESIQHGEITVQKPETIQRNFFRDLLAYPAVISIEYADELRNDIGPSRTLFNTPFSMGISGPQTNYTYRLYDSDAQGTTGKKLLWSQDEYDPRTKSWYLAGATAKSATWTPVYLWPNGDIGLDAVLPIRKNDRLVGVLDTAITLKEITGFLSKIKKTQNTHIYILDRKGDVIAGSDIDSPFLMVGTDVQRMPAKESGNSLLAAALSAIPGATQDLNPLKDQTNVRFWSNRIEYMLTTSAYQDAYGLDWLVVMITPQSDLLTQAGTTNRTFALTLFISIVLSSLCAMGIRRFMVPKEYMSIVDDLHVENTVKQ